MMQGMNGSSMMMQRGQGMGQGGSFSSQVMVMSSRMGEDGKMHTEKYHESSVNAGKLRERQQAYSNSRSGMDKMALERHIDERGRKMVRERNRHNGEERQTQLLRGMEEQHVGRFDQDWQDQSGRAGMTHGHFLGQQGLPGRPQGRLQHDPYGGR